ncbi:putative transcription factor NAM family [Helianthus annuus]|nr:putative transcription factor NAM family [Helianthus annuus]
MGLRDIGATLPPGFRFYPSDDELVCHYLYKKIANEDARKGTLMEIDLHTCEPWQLPGEFRGCSFFFFSFLWCSTKMISVFKSVWVSREL